MPALPSKFHPGTFVFHSDDIEYVFGTLDTRPGGTVRPEDRKLSEQMMSYWTNFAKTGDPNGSGLPAWPRYTPAADRYMEFGNDGHAHARQGERPTFCSLDIPKLKQRLLDNQ